MCWAADSLCLQHRFQPQNPLSAAQSFSPRELPGEEEELRLSAHTLLLPTQGQLEARMMVTAFELGLDNVTEDAVTSMSYAVEVCVFICHYLWYKSSLSQSNNCSFICSWNKMFCLYGLAADIPPAPCLLIVMGFVVNRTMLGALRFLQCEKNIY